jgi:predicted transcriptional regulator of viral defense system
MKATDAYSELLAMNRAIVTTREAGARWQTELRTTNKRLKAIEKAGLIRRLRQGLWALARDIEPNVVAPYLTAPYPAYVSLWSALAQHGIIEQIPRQVSVISLGRARRITTTVGIFQIHRIAPTLFGGFEGTEQTGYLATPEKALFDTAYVRAASGSQAYFSELSLPPDFDRAQLSFWTARIDSPRLQTLVSRRLRSVLARASREGSY